jgi:energy-coupling factor transporter transmembrane protein EcfT
MVDIPTPAKPAKPKMGTPARLALFAWSLLLVIIAPDQWLLAFVGFTLLVNGLLYPASIRRLLRWRWLFFAILVMLPNLLWVGEADATVFGVSVSSSGFVAGMQMILRAMVVIVAVDGLSSSVDITEVAGLFERAGLPGLGFSMGVAVNMLPALRRSSQCTWQSLSMRGGLRHQWWRGIRLLLVTIVASALRRAEEIALAAEVRAYSPGNTRPQPVTKGRYDLIVIGLVVISLAVTFVSRI